MSIAEAVPVWRPLPDPAGPVLQGSSLRGRSYRLRIDGSPSLDAEGVLSARSFDGDRSVFLSPTLRRDTPDPRTLRDMAVAAERLARAVRGRERVVVFGDYDVDGASASAVMGRWFAGMGLDVSIYIPDRLTEGYGPTPKAIERALSGGADLLICVDCGTAATKVLDAVDVDVVVIDHHKQQGDLPAVCAVVNPHRLDDTSELGMLCATALCFLVVMRTQRVLQESGDLPDGAPPIRDLLDIVALATVADVVPLMGPSRLFVAKGLEVIARQPSHGVAALMAVSGVKDVSAGRIGFALGPRVNAGGRVGAGSVDADGALGVRLLMSRSREEADEIAHRLDVLNRTRQEVEKSCLEQAMEMAAEQVAAGRRIVSVHGQGWHPGVVGIVAGRIRERFDVPALVGAVDGGVIKGSGRSVSGFDLGALVVEAVKRRHLETGGGHAMACGFGCRPSEWHAFERFMQAGAKWDRVPEIVDMTIPAHEATLDGISSLLALEPLGQGNPSVRVAFRGLKVTDTRVIGEGHVKLTLSHSGGFFDGLWWRARGDGLEETLLGLVGRAVTAIGTPKVDEWNGRRKISIDLVDLVPAA